MKQIKEFEQIPQIDVEVVKSVLASMKLEEVALACKGTSPDNTAYIAKLYEEDTLKEAIKSLGAVRIADIEKQQTDIINKINEKI